MITEILTYIALFALLFSGAFSTIFKTIDAINYLQIKKTKIEDLYFLSARLDILMRENSDWSKIDEKISAIDNYGGPAIKIISIDREQNISNTNQVLFLDLEVDGEIHEFSYVQEK